VVTPGAGAQGLTALFADARVITFVAFVLTHALRWLLAPRGRDWSELRFSTVRLDQDLGAEGDDLVVG
jgi:hypothetical protein